MRCGISPIKDVDVQNRAAWWMRPWRIWSGAYIEYMGYASDRFPWEMMRGRDRGWSRLVLRRPFFLESLDEDLASQALSTSREDERQTLTYHNSNCNSVREAHSGEEWSFRPSAANLSYSQKIALASKVVNHSIDSAQYDQSAMQIWTPASWWMDQTLD